MPNASRELAHRAEPGDSPTRPPAVTAPPRVRLDRNELAGAFGDIGTDLPLLLAGAASEIVRLFPLPVLGVVLLFEAVALASLVRDVAASRRELMIALVVALSALALPQGYVIGLIVGAALYYARVGTRGTSEEPARAEGPRATDGERP